MGSCPALLSFPSFCKSVSIIPKWPNRCHVELVEAQSHDSRRREARLPAHGSRASVSPGGSSCQPGAAVQKRGKGLLCLSAFFKLKGVLNSADLRAGEHPLTRGTTQGPRWAWLLLGALAPSISEPRRGQASLLRQPFRPLRPGKTVPRGLPPFPLSVQDPHQLVLIVQQVFRKPSGRGTQTGPRVRVQSRERKEGQSREVWWAAVWPPARLSWALRPSFPQKALPCDNTSDLHGRSPPAPESQNTQSGVSTSSHMWKNVKFLAFIMISELA